MRKQVLIVAVGTALAIGAVHAANLNPAHVGSSCAPGQVGIWHFVNNQTGGAAAGVLTATFADAGVINWGADTVNANNQHFTIVGPSGPLLGAFTNIPGRLVLSDLFCEGTPPPCDEKDPDCKEPPK